MWPNHNLTTKDIRMILTGYDISNGRVWSQSCYLHELHARFYYTQHTLLPAALRSLYISTSNILVWQWPRVTLSLLPDFKDIFDFFKDFYQNSMIFNKIVNFKGVFSYLEKKSNSRTFKEFQGARVLCKYSESFTLWNAFAWFICIIMLIFFFFSCFHMMKDWFCFFSCSCITYFSISKINFL